VRRPAAKRGPPCTTGAMVYGNQFLPVQRSCRGCADLVQRSCRGRANFLLAGRFLGASFAPIRASLSPMATNKQRLKAMRQAVAHGPDRSTLFWWMVEHHAELVDAGKQGRMPWKRLCKDFAEEGLTDGRGKAPTELRASRTWREACREVERRMKEAASQVRPIIQRSRPNASWQPPQAAPPAANPAPASSSPPGWDDWRLAPQGSTGVPALPGSSLGAGRQPVSREEVDARVKQLRRTFAERSGHKFEE
jgi:hypothetical protein